MTQWQPDRVVVINDRSAMVGGASNLAILSAGLLERQGLQVTYFAGDAPSPDKPVDDTFNLAGKPLVQQGKLSAFAGGLYNPRAYDALSELISLRDTPSTIYHVHGWSKILSPSIFRALAKVRERTVLHAHDYFLACPNGGFANYRKQQVCDLIPMSAQCLATQCDKRGYHEKLWRSARHLLREQFYPTTLPAHIVVVHERMRQMFERSGVNIERVETIRNPVEPYVTGNIEPSKHRTFYFIGRLEPEKGFEEAAQAARLAGARLHVIGDGAGRAHLERNYPEIVIRGWQSRKGLQSIVQDARAIVISSRVPEPFSLAALEAVSSGIPVIMPDSALLGPEIASLECGLVFRNGDIRSLADSLRRLADDDDLVGRMSANCRREAPHLTHTTSSWTKALMSLYGDVLERSQKAEL
ncbi:MAG: glycosyl transferase family 1 [Shinella sp.]|nr:MAG: glycosyl transferase family 1 [Shinella sp.]